MNQVIVDSLQGVTLAGGGPFSKAALARALRFAPRIVGVDGGADRLLALGAEPEAVIGDLDSISAAARARLAGRLFPISEQITTDFDKALRSIRAPFVLGLGFAGARLDHGLAAMTTLVQRADRRCILVGPKDLAFAAPDHLVLDLRPGDPVSLFPLGRVTGQSTGLEWPIQGLDFAPDGRIGTSNRAVTRRVVLEFDAPGMLVILPRRRLDAAITALRSGRPSRDGLSGGPRSARGG